MSTIVGGVFISWN